MRCVGLVSSVRYSGTEHFTSDGGGYINHYGSYSFQLSLFIVNGERLSWRIHGLCRLPLYSGSGTVWVIVVAQMRYQIRRKSTDRIGDVNTATNDLKFVHGLVPSCNLCNRATLFNKIFDYCGMPTCQRTVENLDSGIRRRSTSCRETSEASMR